MFQNFHDQVAETGKFAPYNFESFKVVANDLELKEPVLETYCIIIGRKEPSTELENN